MTINNNKEAIEIYADLMSLVKDQNLDEALLALSFVNHKLMEKQRKIQHAEYMNTASQAKTALY